MIKEVDAVKESDTIHVACCFDDRLSIPALMLAYSVRHTANKTRRTIFHAVATGIANLPPKISEMLDTDYFEFRLHHVDISVFDAIDMSHAFIASRTTLCRILLPRIVPEARRIIYLDCDIIVNKALDELYDMPMNDCAIAACIDYGMAALIAAGDVASAENVDALIPDRRFYFNSGVLVIDARRWIAEDCENRILTFLGNMRIPLLYADQDALNAIFDNNYVTLDARWNLFAAKSLLEGLPSDEQRALDFARSDPWMIHYVGDFKPWMGHHAATDEDWRFWTLAKQAPFYSDVVSFCKASSETHHRAQMELRPPIVHKRLGEFLCTLAKGIAMGENALSAIRTLFQNTFMLMGIRFTDLRLSILPSTSMITRNGYDDLGTSMHPLYKSPGR